MLTYLTKILSFFRRLNMQSREVTRPEDCNMRFCNRKYLRVSCMLGPIKVWACRKWPERDAKNGNKSQLRRKKSAANVFLSSKAPCRSKKRERSKLRAKLSKKLIRKLMRHRRNKSNKPKQLLMSWSSQRKKRKKLMIKSSQRSKQGRPGHQLEQQAKSSRAIWYKSKTCP